MVQTPELQSFLLIHHHSKKGSKAIMREGKKKITILKKITVYV